MKLKLTKATTNKDNEEEVDFPQYTNLNKKREEKVKAIEK
jgi:hypothetical protein